MPTDAELEQAELLRLIQSREAEWEQTKLFRLYPDTGPLRRELYKKHIRHFAAGREYSERALVGGNRSGKALANGTPVLTPHGFTPIETLLVGDTVIGGDGMPCYVTGVFPQGERDTVSLLFDDGAEVTCDREHLWKCRQGSERYHGNKEWHVRTTAHLLAHGAGDGNPQKVAEIPTCSCYMTQQGVDVDPYIIGALLGDGCLTGTSSQPYISTNDKEIVDHFSKFYALKHSPNTYDYGISGGLVTQLKALGVWGTYSYDKKVPKDYLFNSKPVRLAVLRGLMDTDGYVDARGMHTVFYTTSTQLAEGVVFLVRSLGGKAKTLPKQTYYFQRGEKVAGRPGWAIMIRIAECPFALPRKANRWHEVTKSSPHRRLVSATDAGSRDCTCISVDSPDNTYVTKDFIVTHNTMACSFETTCHLIGWYPPWWEGFRFNRPIVAWASGEDTKAVRESLQFTFLGAIDHFGTGLIPKRNILGTTARSGVPEAIDAITIKSNHGGVSRLVLKSYDQGRESFQAAAVDVMQFDEEPPSNIYSEGMTRVLSTVPGQPNGLVICGFTPLKGLSEVVLSYMPGGSITEGAVT